jgi:hypothetical protein
MFRKISLSRVCSIGLCGGALSALGVLAQTAVAAAPTDTLYFTDLNDNLYSVNWQIDPVRIPNPSLIDGNIATVVAPAVVSLNTSTTHHGAGIANSTSMYQPVNANAVFVLGSDGNLWLETGPWNGIQHTIDTRKQVDAQVTYFWAVDSKHVFVVGNDGNLWYETAPTPSDVNGWGNVQAVIDTRQQVDGRVAEFQVLNSRTLVVEGYGGNLWLETASPTSGWSVGNTIGTRKPIDGNVQSFSAVDENTIFVQGEDNKLWLEKAPWNGVDYTIATRIAVDANVSQVQALDANHIMVIGTDGKLWLENGPFANIPQTIGERDLIDVNVYAAGALNTAELYVIDSFGNLWFEDYANKTTEHTLVYAGVRTASALQIKN